MIPLKFFLKALTSSGRMYMFRPENCFAFKKGAEDYRYGVDRVITNDSGGADLWIQIHGTTRISYPKRKADIYSWSAEDWYVESDLLHATLIYVLAWEGR